MSSLASSRVFFRKIKAFGVIVSSSTFALLLALLPNEYFRDRANYIVYAKDSLSIMGRYDGLALFTNEPLFLLLNSALSFFIDVELVPLFFVFFTAFTICYFVFLRSRNLLLTALALLALVLVPQSFHMLLVVLRQAFTAALLMWIVYYFWSTRFFLLLVFFLGFFHSSAFILFAFLSIDKIFSYFVSNDIVLRVCFSIFISALVSFLIMPLAQVLSLRQAVEYQNTIGSGGGGILLFILECS